VADDMASSGRRSAALQQKAKLPPPQALLAQALRYSGARVHNLAAAVDRCSPESHPTILSLGLAV